MYLQAVGIGLLYSLGYKEINNLSYQKVLFYIFLEIKMSHLPRDRQAEKSLVFLLVVTSPGEC